MEPAGLASFVHPCQVLADAVPHPTAAGIHRVISCPFRGRGRGTTNSTPECNWRLRACFMRRPGARPKSAGLPTQPPWSSSAMGLALPCFVVAMLLIPSIKMRFQRGLHAVCCRPKGRGHYEPAWHCHIAGLLFAFVFVLRCLIWWDQRRHRPGYRSLRMRSSYGCPARTCGTG